MKVKQKFDEHSVKKIFELFRIKAGLDKSFGEMTDHSLIEVLPEKRTEVADHIDEYISYLLSAIIKKIEYEMKKSYPLSTPLLTNLQSV